MQRFPATIVALVAIGLGIASAQNNPGVPVGGGGITQQQLDDAVAAVQNTVMAAMPQPGNVTPPTDNTAGAIGAATTRFMREDAVRPARYRAGNCTITGGAGQCTIPWSTAFAVTPQPVANPTVINPNFVTAQLTCNWVSLSTTQGVVGCRSSVLSLAILGPILTLLGNGATVYGTAIQPL